MIVNTAESFDQFLFICKNCTHKNVCKYRDEFEEGKRNIENDASAYEDVLYVNVSCTRFHGDTNVRRGVK